MRTDQEFLRGHLERDYYVDGLYDTELYSKKEIELRVELMKDIKLKTKLRLFLKKIKMLIKDKPKILILREEGMAMIREFHEGMPFVSYFIIEKFRGKGLGKIILRDLVISAMKKYNTLFAIVEKDNKISLHIMKKYCKFTIISAFDTKFILMRKGLKCSKH